jgi:Cu+-exporting ATPase
MARGRERGHEGAAQAVARQVGIDPGPDTVIAGVLLAGKVDVVWRLQRTGR